MTDPRFISIPASNNGSTAYPGMLKHHLGGEKCLQVYGANPEGQRALSEAVAAREVAALKNRPPLIEGEAE